MCFWCFKGHWKRPMVWYGLSNMNYLAKVNPLSANPTKWSDTLKQFVANLPTNCLSVFDHFVILALKGLIADLLWINWYQHHNTLKYTTINDQVLINHNTKMDTHLLIHEKQYWWKYLSWTVTTFPWHASWHLPHFIIFNIYMYN